MVERRHPEGPVAAELPLRVRRQLAELAAAALGDLPEDEVPASLRRVRAFAPARRARAAGAQLLTALDTDAALRGHTALLWSRVRPDLAAGLAEPAPGADGGVAGVSFPAGPSLSGIAGDDAENRLAGVFLSRPDGWQDLVAGLVGRLSAAEVDRQARHAGVVARARADATAEELRRVRAELARVRTQVDTQVEEIAGLRRERRRLRADLDRARATARAAEQETVEAAERARVRDEEATAAVRRAAEQAAVAQERLAQARRSAREGRSLVDIRARLLLDTIIDAAAGLRRELALPPATQRPADLTVASAPEAGGPAPALPVRARSGDDPVLLEQMLALPQSHLVVDGYNVTKTGYGGLPLAEQRRRLVEGLGVLAVRTASEVTCCFDGADVDARGASRVRGVRVVFSEPGVTADELIHRLVRAEPPGRPVAVVSSDAEVVTSSRAAGARAVSAVALLRLLGGRG